MGRVLGLALFVGAVVVAGKLLAGVGSMVGNGRVVIRYRKRLG